MAESYPNGEKALWEKEKLLVINVFKRLVSQGRQKVSLCGNGLNWCNDVTSELSEMELSYSLYTFFQIGPFDYIPRSNIVRIKEASILKCQSHDFKHDGPWYLDLAMT